MCRTALKTLIGRKWLRRESALNEYEYFLDVLNVLSDLPSQSAVVGIPDETLMSESVVAFVTLAPGATVTAQELQKYCRDRLAIYKCPKRVEFVEQLPKNSTGKIMKRALRDRKGAV